jgi:hypothetical protein
MIELSEHGLVPFGPVFSARGEAEQRLCRDITPLFWAYRGGGTRGQHFKARMPALDKGLPEMCRLILRFCLWAMSGKCLVRHPISNKMVPMWPRPLQWHLASEMYAQALAVRPIRIVGLKARKGGFTTWVQAFYYFLCRELENYQAMTLAHVDDETRAIFRIVKRIMTADPDCHEEPPSGKIINFDKNGSVYSVRTGGGEYVASGDTLNAIEITELAKWQGGEVEVSDQMMSLFGAVPESPLSIIVIESTANMSDRSGEFERRYKAASKGANEFVPVFIPWFWEPLYRLKGKELTEFDEDEKSLIEQHELDDDQLRWRRGKIATSYNGDVNRFRQEYPSTSEEAFQLARGRIFPMLNVAKHGYSATVEQLTMGGYQFFRGIDFGGSDPFVCAWIAHKPGPPGLTIDIAACPDGWREITSYSRDDKGKPQDRNNHFVDCLRYCAVSFHLTGHLHVYRLLYVPDSAHRGLSVVDLAAQVNQLTGREQIVATVADRSRPDSIVLLGQQGIHAQPNRHPESAIRGEIEDGLAHLTALLIATIPLLHPPPPEPIASYIKRKRANSPIDFGFGAGDLAIVMEKTPEDGLHPIFGVSY